MLGTTEPESFIEPEHLANLITRQGSHLDLGWFFCSDFIVGQWSNDTLSFFFKHNELYRLIARLNNTEGLLEIYPPISVTSFSYLNPLDMIWLYFMDVLLQVLTKLNYIEYGRIMVPFKTEERLPQVAINNKVLEYDPKDSIVSYVFKSKEEQSLSTQDLLDMYE